MEYEFMEENNRIVAMDKEGKEAGEVTFTNSEENTLFIDHTEVDENHRGQGLGGQLIQQVVNKAKNENLKVTPLCMYARKVFERKKEYQEVLQNE